MSGYIYELSDWPGFRWDQKALEAPLAAVRHRQGRLIGRMEGLGFALRKEAVLQTVTLDVVKSSEIEREILNPEQVRSSVARRLGMDVAGVVPVDCDVEGVVEMMLDATQHFDEPLIAERLFGWHGALFPTGRSGLNKIRVGEWRDDSGGPMHGPIGNSAGNPSITIVEWMDSALARSEGSAQRFYSMSAQIRHDRDAYYDVLEKTQKDTLDITPWLEWFLGCLDCAFTATEGTLAAIFSKARFWEKHAASPFNERQRLILNKILDGFEGKLTSSKWAKLTKCSQDTAHRDILDLVEHGVLVKDSPGGRSTSYSLNLT